jgi:RimJ/RimL family protein N-acetyltransferase
MAPTSEESLHSLPRAFINKKGEAILVHLLDENVTPRLVQMYLAFQPRNSFQGLPPVKDEACVKWVEQMAVNATNLVALSFEKGVVGHAALFPMKDSACEFLVVVSPPLQNTGVGTELTRSAIQVSYEMGFETMWLDVDATNVRARHVYKKCGFAYLSDGHARELEMTLDLKRYRDAVHASVSQIMGRPYATIGADESCRAALRLFLSTGADALPVVEADGEFLGIIAESDLMLPSNLDKNVRDVLTWQVPTAGPDCTIAKLVRIFQSQRIRCIPVLDAQRKLLGVVDRKDVLVYYAGQFAPADSAECAG